MTQYAALERLLQSSVLKPLMKVLVIEHLGTIIGWLSKLGSLFGCLKYQVPYYNKDPKRDHNFDNYPILTKYPEASSRLHRRESTKTKLPRSTNICCLFYQRASSHAKDACLGYAVFTNSERVLLWVQGLRLQGLGVQGLGLTRTPTSAQNRCLLKVLGHYFTYV